MAGSGDDPYEPFFRAGGPAVTGVSGGVPPPRPATPPRAHRADRHGTSSPAQQRLMARIAANRRAGQRRACLVAAGLVSSLVLFVAGSAWALTGSVHHLVAAANSSTMAAAPGAPPVFGDTHAGHPLIKTAQHTHRHRCHPKKRRHRREAVTRTACR